MVGVPALHWWVLTSSWMYWPHLSLVSQRIIRGPSRMDSTSAVINAAAVRKVMYRKTFKAVICPARGTSR